MPFNMRKNDPGRVIRILVVDDDEAVLGLIGRFCQSVGGLEFTGFAQPHRALEWAKNGPFDIALFDYKMPGMDGLTLARQLMALRPDAYYLIMTAHADLTTAVEALRAGVFDFLTKPFEITELETALARVEKHLELRAQNQMLREMVRDSSGKGGLAGASPALAQMARLFAQSNAPVLITGETGMGKEVVARMIHGQSRLGGGAPFIAVNCSAFAETLLESELFGHEKGAFTGADRQRKGRLEFAGPGVILLDEICDIAPPVQVKLLRVLQERAFERVGGNTPIPLNARVISATNKVVEDEIGAGRFREDLYYRLNTLRIHIPPLRERREDIEVLADHFLRRFATALGKQIAGFSPAAREALLAYPWPGNVRQLENTVDYAALACEGGVIALEHLPWEVAENQPPAFAAPPPARASAGDAGPDRIPEMISGLEKKRIRESLEKHRWNKSKAALELGITRRQLTYRLQKYGIE